MHSLTIDPMYMWLKCHENHKENKNSYEEYKKNLKIDHAFRAFICLSLILFPGTFGKGQDQNIFQQDYNVEIMKSATDW